MGRGVILRPWGTWLLLVLEGLGLWVIDNLFPDHVGLPHVLDLAVHLVQLTTWMGRGVILRLFPFKNFFPIALLHG